VIAALVALLVASGHATPLLLAVFAAGIGLMLSISNVYFRDTQYLLSILLQFWMYLTPIIYPLTLVATASKKTGGIAGSPITVMNIYELNPMVHFITLFRQLIYDNRWPDGVEWIICLCWALAALGVGLFVFQRNERNLAEAL